MLVKAAPLVCVRKANCVPLVLIKRDHQPFVAGLLLLPISNSLPSAPGPVPELVVLLFQSGLYQKRTLPLRQLTLAARLASTSLYSNRATLVSISTAFPFQPAIEKRLLESFGNWPCSPIQVFVLKRQYPRSTFVTLLPLS